MRTSILVATLLGLLGLGCGRAQVAARPAIAATCAPDRIGAVIVDGAPATAVAQLAVLDGTLDDAARAERVRQVAVDALRAQGYARATIALSRKARCGVELRARVTLGRKYTIERIAFETDDEFPDRKRLAVIEDGLGTVNTIGGTYVADRLTRGLVELRRRYADAGWLEAAISAPQVVFDDGGRISITIPVRPGARFTIGSIRAIGAGKAGRQVLDAMGLREGEYYDKSLVRAGIERARRRLDRWIQLRIEVAPDRTEIDVEAIVEGR